MSTAPRELPTTPASAHDAQPALLARYETLVDVRHAIDTLESHGVDGDKLALVGDPAAHLGGSTDRRRADRRFLANTTVALVVGVMAGALLGALLGAAIIGLVLLLWSGLEDKGWVYALMIAWFAVGGSVLGGFWAISRSVGFSESWPLTFEDEPDGPLWLAVYADPATVEDVVPDTHPLEVVRDPDTRTAHPLTASSTEPEARPEREGDDVPQELVDAAADEAAIPADESNEG
jgi:hypothetical protein